MTDILKATVECKKKRISLRFFRIFDYSMLRDTSCGDERRKLGVSLAQIYLTKHRINKQLSDEIEYIKSQS